MDNRFYIELDIENNSHLKELRKLKIQNDTLRNTLNIITDKEIREAIESLQLQVQLDLDELLIKATAGIFDDYVDGLQDFVYNGV